MTASRTRWSTRSSHSSCSSQIDLAGPRPGGAGRPRRAPGDDAVRPGGRAADPGGAAAAGRGRARAGAGDPPHRRRWLVDGRAARRGRRPLCGAVRHAAAAADPIRRRRAVAAGTAGRRHAGAPARLLARRAGRRARHARPAARPAPPLHARGRNPVGPRRHLGLVVRRRARDPAARRGAAVGRDAVHADADGDAGGAGALERAVRSGGRHAGGPAHPAGDGVADRIFRQHAGAAGAVRARHAFRRRAAARPPDAAGRAGASGRPVRARGRGRRRRTHRLQHAADPGHGGARTGRAPAAGPGGDCGSSRWATRR